MSLDQIVDDVPDLVQIQLGGGVRVHHGGVVVIEPEREIDWSRAAEAHRALLTKSAPAKPKTALLCGICKEPHESVRKAEAACTYCRAVESAL